MSAVLNDRDAVLQAATVRIVNPKNAWINLTASAPGFHLNAAGQVDLAKVTVTADLVGLDDAVTFTAVGGTLSNAVGRSVDVTYGGQTAIVTAKVISNGDEFQRALIIPVLRDGASGTGTPGARGAGHYYGSGAAWTDTLANITVPTTKVVGDVVTISSGTFVMEKRWTGSAWVENGVVVDGKLIVPLSILAGSIDTRNLDIKDANGNIIFRAGLTMAEQAQINPNLVESFRSWIMGGASVTYDPAAAINGEALLLPPNTYAQSRVLALEPDVDYIVSFRALSQQANTALSVDLFPDNLPEFSTGPLTAVNKYFQFNMRSSASQMAAATLRFLGSANGHILISDVKLERGSKATAWCDNVISQSNVGQKVMPNSIGNTQIGGDLFSTNWNGGTDKYGAGWLMSRAGILYCNDVRARGTLSGGDFTPAYAWPSAAGQVGYHISASGALWGNPIDGRYLQITAGGEIYSPFLNVNAAGLKVKGEVSGSVIRTSVMALESARLLTAWNRLAPFVVYDTGMVFNTAVGSRSVTLTGFRGPAEGAEYVYDSKRFSSFKKDVFLEATLDGEGGMETLIFEAMYHDNGAWSEIGRVRASVDYRSGFSLAIRYTPADGGWDRIAFRCRTTESHTLSIVFKVTVYNFNESGNAPYSTSGVSGNDGGGSGGTAPPREDWCVDYETARFPNGSYVRDVKVNDLVEVWNDNPDQPKVELAPALQVRMGAEQSYLMRTESGVEIIQSRSTPMTLRDGGCKTTNQMLGEEVLVNRKGVLQWERVTVLEDMGERRVVKLALGDRMYFAGVDPKATIATHNVVYQYKP